MIEGLWAIRFLLPSGVEGDLSGGVAVIESGRLLGGDSGYFYVGDIDPISQATWRTKLAITRHDPSIESFFGDLDTFNLEGLVRVDTVDDLGRQTLTAEFPGETGRELRIRMTKVAQLP
jgi:hypothetical protein